MAVMMDGRRVYGKPGNNKNEAKANLKAKLEELNKPKIENDPNLATYYYEQFSRLKSELAPTTYALYEIVYETRVRKDPLGGILLSELKPEHVQAWVDSLHDVLPSSRARYLQCVKAILQYAFKTRWIDSNPASPIKAGKIEEHFKEVLTRSEVNQLLAMEMSDRLRKGILLCLHGLRRAEACGLKYEDFDGEGVTIKRQALEVSGQLIIQNATKTGETRWVPVNEELRHILSKGTGWVLESATGQPLRPRNFAREWSLLVKGDSHAVREKKLKNNRPVRESTVFAGLTLHDLRSTCGTLLLEGGVDVRTASEILGHSPAMLSKVYARSRKELKQAAMTKIFS